MVMPRRNVVRRLGKADDLIWIMVLWKAGG
jgi:hypothetical protein